MRNPPPSYKSMIPKLLMLRKAAFLICIIFLLLSCTASKIELHKKYAHGGPLVPREAFNNYQSWFDRYYPTDKKLDMTMTIRVQGFGRLKDKQAAWDKEWRTRHPDWGPVDMGAAVSSDPIEIWMDIREDGLGNLMLPPHVLGHQMEHALIINNWRRQDFVYGKNVVVVSVVPKQSFENYQEWFVKLYPTDKQIDATLTVRFRAFGRLKDKQAAWDKEWRSGHPDWGPVPAGITVSSNPIEIWMDLKQDKLGNIIMPPHALGHEMEHALILNDSRIENPHLRVEQYIYERPSEQTDQPTE